MDTSRISPTAHYTGTVWARNGLSDPALTGSLKPTLYWAAAPLVWATAPLVGGLSLDDALLQRHRIVDAVLTEAIEAHGVRQVVEIAAGMSARGLRFTRKYADLTYVEGDLPGMSSRKQAALEGLRGPRHHVLTVNALLDEGPQSMREATRELLDPAVPTALITEGLLNYLDHATLRSLWTRIAGFLSGFSSGVYLTDLITEEAAHRHWTLGLFFQLLSMVARGRVMTHFGSDAEASAFLGALGFDRVTTHGGADWRDRIGVPVSRGGDVQVIVEAWRGVQRPR